MSDEADEMIRRANARRSKRWPFIAGVLALFSLPFLYIGWAHWSKHRQEHRFDLDADGRKELAQKLDDADKEIAKREATYRAVVTREKLAAIEPAAALCPINASYPIELTRPNADVPLADTIAQHASTVRWFRKKLADGIANLDDLRRARSLASQDGWSGGSDTLLFADEIVEARMTRDPETYRIGFAPGRVVGRSYVYSYDASRIVCAGRLEGKSSPTIEVKYQSTSISPTLEDPATFLARTEAEKSKLWEDLVSQTKTAAKESLRAVP